MARSTGIFLALLTAYFLALSANVAQAEPDDDSYLAEESNSPDAPPPPPSRRKQPRMDEEQPPDDQAPPPRDSRERRPRDARDARDSSEPPARPAKPAQKQLRRDNKKPSKRNYFTDNTPRTDAGVFHVAAVIGGNFYTEPQIGDGTNGTTKGAPTGEYFKDFGFAVGVQFDYDYSELEDNIPLCLRGMFGYKYILNSVHVGTFDGIVRHMWRFSEKSSFGLGIGGSAAVWYRAITATSPNEEIIFLPSFIIEGGFDFNPLMVDMRLLINRIGQDATIAGAELYLGLRL